MVRSRDALVCGAILIVGCDREALDAERQYRIVSTTGSSREKCDAAERVMQEWLRRENQAKYEQWKLTRDVYCQNARLGID